METIKINGKSYLIDIEKAIEQGLLKEKNNRPRSWEEYATCFSPERSIIVSSTSINDDEECLCDYDVFNSIDEAEAFCALGKLIQLRDAWWGDWRPDWTDDEQDKFVIHYYIGEILKECLMHISHILAFPTEKMRDDFLSTFRDLIEQAKMFL